MSEQVSVETVRQAAARKAWETIRARRAAAGFVTLQKTVQRRAVKEAVEEVSKEVNEAEQEQRDTALRKALLKLQDLRWRQTGRVSSIEQLLSEGLLVGQLLEKGDLDQVRKIMGGVEKKGEERLVDVQGENVMSASDYQKIFNKKYRGSRY